MRDFRSAIASSLIAFAAWTATTSPSPADTGSVHVLFSKAGIIAAVGNGTGVLTFHGKKYPFDISGASFGATLALSIDEFVGQAQNLRNPGDLAGTYTAVGAAGALVAGAGAVRLQNANGVVLVLSGPRLGVELSASLARITITMK
ncbi:hypothetical protein AAFX91_19315 [Bradyrhizobium sp. 31Argb]|uniref:hypothetical protein n=1 Tax=unclassified Bradyrhizobium TaxID=2631580 RepID=UPI00102E660A|nr:MULTISPECIES: hypothetical protein [unclassified Bradyrhizobium]MDI4234603.1 hypothetical protein [Bradyrhizobium sp. Arg237L]TAI63026.1 hypothetical protein CWO89_26440 [Bradyrhizobium sp. Leo170]